MSETNPEIETPRRQRVVHAFLTGDRTPMWFTGILLIAGAIGTYYLAPTVNATFEEQKVKSDFVIRNYGDLRTKMEDFQGLYAVVAQKVAAGEDAHDDVLKLQEIVARVSAQNLSLLPIFTSEGGPKAAADLNAAMVGMINLLFANAGKAMSDEEAAKFNQDVAGATQKMVSPLLELYVRIAEVGRLAPTEKDAELRKE